MLKKFLNILTLITFSLFLKAQETGYGPGFQVSLISNPAFAGAENDGTMRLSYLNFYPGNHYDLHTFYFSYDSFFPALHGGAGVWIADDYLGGIVNDIRGGMSYSYFLRAGEDLYINAGLSISAYHRGFDFSGAVLPDQIDPIGGVIYPSGETMTETGKTVFDVGTGFLFMYKDIFAGISVTHLSQPDISAGSTTDKLRRKITIHAAGDIIMNEIRKTVVRPAFFAELQGKQIVASAGASTDLKFAELNLFAIQKNSGNFDIQTGFALKMNGVAIFYNYRFNVHSDNSLLPLSMIHQTGIVLSLNHVDKRSGYRTITLPKM
jgi:type IX secretion system PorP/SprF family membrane protein